MSEENILNSGEAVAPEVAPVESTVTETSPVETPVAAPESTGFLSDDLLAQSNLKDFTSPDDLAKSYVELQRMVGNSVRIPSEDASPEAKQDFRDKIKGVEGILVEGDPEMYARLGKPETAAGYDFEDLIAPELTEADPSITSQVDEFKSLALDLNLTSAQAKSLAEWQVGQTTESTAARMAAETEYKENTMSTLKELYGTELDNRLQAAKKVIDIYGEKYGEEASNLMNSSAGNNPVFIAMLSELGELYTEKGHAGMSGAEFGMTPENAQLKIIEKRQDRGFQEKMHDERHPEHQEAMAEMRQLYQLANGG